MLTTEAIDQAAADLFEAERTKRQIPLLSRRWPEMTMGEAYAIRAALIQRKLAAGRRIIGWKVGLTSKAMQRALNINTPDSGVLFDDMLFPDGAVIPADRFIQPRIEAEIAFVMKAPLSGPVDRAAVLAATDYVAPALEILDTRILRKDPETGQARIIVDTIADNAANAGVVLGEARHAPEAVDLRWVGAIVSLNGVVEETGLGAGVLNDPVKALQWLSESLGADGQELRAGDVVLSGSFIHVLEAPSGSRFEADFGAFGSVSCAFD